MIRRILLTDHEALSSSRCKRRNTAHEHRTLDGEGEWVRDLRGPAAGIYGAKRYCDPAR